MGISRDALRLALGHVDQAPQEAPGSLLVPVRAAHGVEEHSLAVDGAIERAPAPGDLHVGLVQGPGAAGVAAPLRAPPIREQRGEAALPGADRLVAALEAALEEPLGDVPETPRLSRRRQRTASRTLSVGSWRSVNGVPVRSLHRRRQARQRNRRESSAVRLFRFVVAVAVQSGHASSVPSPFRGCGSPRPASPDF